MKIGIVGSRRRFTDKDQMKVVKAFDKIESQLGVWVDDDGKIDPNRVYGCLTIISGGCRHGADCWAEQIASIRGIPIMIYHADWKTWYNAAGPIRNTYIARDSDVLIACVAPDRTGGTEDTIRKFKEYHPDGKLIIV